MNRWSNFLLRYNAHIKQLCIFSVEKAILLAYYAKVTPMHEDLTGVIMLRIGSGRKR